MRETRFELPFYSFYDLNGMARHLEAMAAKGWQLDRITNFAWHYRRAEPQKLHYAVSYYAKASAFEPEPSDGQLTFQEFCDYGGWRLAACNAQLQVFCNEREDPTPIHTDPATELESILGMGKRMLLASGVLLLLCLLQLWMNVGRLLDGPIGVLSDATSLFTLFLWPLLGLYLALDLITWLRWRKRAAAAAEQGEFLAVRGHDRLLRVVLAFATLGLLGILVMDRRPGFRGLMLAMLAGMAALMLLVNGTRLLLKKKKAPTSVNRAVTIIVDVVLAFAIIAGITWGFIRAADSGLVSFWQQDAEMAVTVADLTEEDDTDYIEEYFSSATLLLKNTEFHNYVPYWVREGETEPLPSLRYQLVEVRAGFLYSVCRNQLLHEYDDWGVEGEGSYGYRPMNPTPWGTAEAWQLWREEEPRDTYLLCWPDRLVKLEPSWLLTPEQMALAGERLAPEK